MNACIKLEFIGLVFDLNIFSKITIYISFFYDNSRSLPYKTQNSFKLKELL